MGWERMPAKPPPSVMTFPRQEVPWSLDWEAPPITTSSKGPHTKPQTETSDRKLELQKVERPEHEGKLKKGKR